MELSAHKIFLVFFLLAGLMVDFQTYEPGKNVKICNFTDIVPAATDHFPSNQKRPCWKEKLSGRFDGKNFMKHEYLKSSNRTGVGGTMSCL